MIKDIEKARYIHFGHGTVAISVCQNKNAYAIYQTEYHPIDGIHRENPYGGKQLEELPVKSIALVFDGEEAIKSIDMIIEDLQIIKENLRGTTK